MRPLLALLVLLALAPIAAAEIGNVGVQPGESKIVFFDELGTFPYHCHPHPAMKGIVHVGDGTPTNVTVRIRDFRYEPDVVNVTLGSAVTFVNEDEVFHTVTGEGGHGGHGNAVPAPAALPALAAAALAGLALRRR